MDFLNFILIFCAIMLLFEVAHSIVGLIFLGILNIFKSTVVLQVTMVIDKILYCFFVISSSILTIETFHTINQSILFLLFMIVISLIWFLLFFADKRNNAKKMNAKNQRSILAMLIEDKYAQSENQLIYIEAVFILLFIPLVFYPNLITNKVTLFIFDALYYVSNIKILGTILGIIGLVSLIKYIKITIVLLYRYLLNSKKDS